MAAGYPQPSVAGLGKFFNDWDRSLAVGAGQQLKASEAFEPFSKLIGFQLDNHSGPLGSSFGSGSYTAVLAEIPSGTCTSMMTQDGAVIQLDIRDAAQRPVRALAPDLRTSLWYIAYPGKRGVPAELRCGGKAIQVRASPMMRDSKRLGFIQELTKTEADVPVYRRLSSELFYLRLPTFSKENDERFRALLSTIPEPGHEPFLLVDLRMNQGGDAPLDELQPWLNRKIYDRVVVPNRRHVHSCAYAGLRWGYTEITMSGIHPPITDALRLDVQQMLDGLKQVVPDGCPVVIHEDQSSWNYLKHRLPLHPRMLVLVDKICGSDCELLTYVLAAMPGTVIAGVNTFGVCQFIQPGYFVLPYTRTPFRIATGRSDLYGDNRSFDGYGFNVDVLLSSEQQLGREAIIDLAARLRTLRH